MVIGIAHRGRISFLTELLELQYDKLLHKYSGNYEFHESEVCNYEFHESEVYINDDVITELLSCCYLSFKAEIAINQKFKSPKC